ncbi:selenium cofactor biosynthesis protein YqeC [Desulfomicrobium salsuginis]
MTGPETMTEALALPERGLLAIVGAGGKTTAMYRLAAELAERGRRVACTTTTRIFPPEPRQARLILAENNEALLGECRDAAAPGRPVCIAWAMENGKLMGLTPEFIHRLLDAEIFDWILVEADGARCLPLKAPATHEPVVPGRSTHVLAVAGLTGVGAPLDERHVCRSTCFEELSGLAFGTPVTPASVARVCAHPEGLFKGAPQGAAKLLWLNQADAPQALEHGRAILDLLHDAGAMPRRACIGSAGRTPCVMEVRS